MNRERVKMTRLYSYLPLLERVRRALFMIKKGQLPNTQRTLSCINYLYYLIFLSVYVASIER